MNPSPVEIGASILFALAVFHLRALSPAGGAAAGLTLIANAPNPAGFSILKGHFEEQSIHPLGLLIAALAPTVVAMLAFLML